MYIVLLMAQYIDPLQTIVVKLIVDPSLVLKEVGCSMKGQPWTAESAEAIYKNTQIWDNYFTINTNPLISITLSAPSWRWQYLHY